MLTVTDRSGVRLQLRQGPDRVTLRVADTSRVRLTVAGSAVTPSPATPAVPVPP